MKKLLWKKAIQQYIQTNGEIKDVLMLNTKFVPEVERTSATKKPKSIVEYNKHKSYIDISGKK